MDETGVADATSDDPTPWGPITARGRGPPGVRAGEEVGPSPRIVEDAPAPSAPHRTKMHVHDPGIAGATDGETPARRDCDNGGTQIRTGDTTIFSRVLYQLSYPAGARER